jgi:hypothetical protein
MVNGIEYPSALRLMLLKLVYQVLCLDIEYYSIALASALQMVARNYAGVRAPIGAIIKYELFSIKLLVSGTISMPCTAGFPVEF